MFKSDIHFFGEFNFSTNFLSTKKNFFWIKLREEQLFVKPEGRKEQNRMESTSRQIEKLQTRRSLSQICPNKFQQEIKLNNIVVNCDNYLYNNPISTIITTTKQNLSFNRTRSSLRSLPEQNLQKMLRKFSNVEGLKKRNVKKNFRKFSLQVTNGIQEFLDEKGK